MKKFLVGCGSIFGTLLLLGACAPAGSDVAEPIENEQKDTEDKPKENDNQNKPEEKKEDSSGVTLDNFQKIENGMTYEEVVEILGKEGELLSEAGSGQYKTEMYQWEAENGFGANMNVTFQNGKVQSKAQAGLE